ncbi:11532_t:CDS:2, partial [Dentiscutata erythropus]
KVDPIFFKKVQWNGNYLLISSYNGDLVNVFCLENSRNNQPSTILSIQEELELAIRHEDSSDNEENNYEANLDYLHRILDKTKMLLEESRNKPKGHLWLKNVRSNFKSLEKMNNDITALNN